MQRVSAATPTEPTHGSIGIQLRRAMDAKKMKPEELAYKLDISVSSLYRVLRGDKPLTYREACLASVLLDRPLDWFVGDEAIA